ncbi:MAG TPA: DUF3592 domain-containing protein [candidate division Zixibacteria bacterium]|nr:DUF3592 domain-containing protein [candidate division Zixibacteria bacterium]
MHESKGYFLCSNDPSATFQYGRDFLSVHEIGQVESREMLNFIIFAACVLVIVATRLIMGLLKHVPSLSSRLLYACVILLIAGIPLIYFNANKLVRLDARRHWPTTMGQVVESEVHGKDAIRPLVVYTYEVNGATYTDSSALQAPVFGNGRKEYEVARELSGEHPKGSNVRVYYDPKDPKESTLMPEAPWDVYGKIGLGATLFMLGLFGILLPRRKQRAPSGRTS